MLSVYTPEQLIAKYSNLVFVLYCMSLVFVVAFNHYLYRSDLVCITLSLQKQSMLFRTSFKLFFVGVEKPLFQIAQKMLAHIGVQCCHFLMLLYLELLDLAQSCLQNHCRLYFISSRSMYLGC